MEFLGSEPAQFSFGASTKSQQMVAAALNPPQGTVEETLCVQPSTLQYTGQKGVVTALVSYYGVVPAKGAS